MSQSRRRPEPIGPRSERLRSDKRAESAPAERGADVATPHQPQHSVIRSPRFVPIEAKLCPPRRREGTVSRGELVDRLRETHAPVVLITGPPGYGKTTLLANWDSEDERPFVWLTLDDSDNDPGVLVTYLVLALQRSEPIDAAVLAELGSGDEAMSTVVLPRLGGMVARRDGPFVLVLDDAEALREPAALDVVTAVARHLPDGSQLAVAARATPDLPWAKLRAQRRLFEIGTADLKLTRAEGVALITAAGLDLTPDETSGLLERTEGWAAGLYLAAVSVLHSADPHRAAALVTGEDSAIAEYLHDELLAGMSPEETAFVTRTSILTRLCGSLCDAVLATTGSADMIEALQSANLLVVPLDRRAEWYRYHRLYADMLRSELHRREAGIVPLLHQRAVNWLDHHGEVEEAIHHAQAAGEVQRAAQLVWPQVASHVGSGRRATVERWLDGFTGKQLIGHAELALAAAWCAVETGRAVEHWVAAAERGKFDASRPGAADAIASAIAVLHATLAGQGVTRMSADAELAERLQAADDPWRPRAQYVKGVACHLTGRREEAAALLEQAADLASSLEVPSTRALCFAQLALLATEKSEWDAAAARIDGAMACLAEYDLLDAPSMVAVHGVLSLVLAKQGKVQEAKRRINQSMRMLANMHHLAPWAAVQTRTAIGRAYVMLGDTPAARVVLSEAQSHIHQVPDAGVLRDWLNEVWRHIEQYPLATNVGPTTLTTAELRVLQFLPTHLSFGEIAKRLYVSRNTVKTQAISAYRKMGVSSRSEAVERAEALGVIEL